VVSDALPPDGPPLDGLGSVGLENLAGEGQGYVVLAVGYKVNGLAILGDVAVGYEDVSIFDADFLAWQKSVVKVCPLFYEN